MASAVVSALFPRRQCGYADRSPCAYAVGKARNETCLSFVFEQGQYKCRMGTHVPSPFSTEPQTSEAFVVRRGGATQRYAVFAVRRNGVSAVCSDEAADTTAELGCGSACHGKPPHVSYDPSGCRSVRGKIPALPAARSDRACTGDGSLPDSLDGFPAVPSNGLGFCCFIHTSVPASAGTFIYPPNRCGRPIRWLRVSANRVCHLRCSHRFPARLRRSGV